MKISDEQREKYFNVFITVAIVILFYPVVFNIGQITTGCKDKQRITMPLIKFYGPRHIILPMFFIFLGLGLKNKWDTQLSTAWWWPILLILLGLFIYFSMKKVGCNGSETVEEEVWYEARSN